MSSAKEIADERLARGEITVNQHREIMETLTASKGVGPAKANTSGKTHRLEINDGVMDVGGYSGVKTEIEFITQFNGGLGLFLLVIGLFRGDTWQIALGIGLLFLTIGSLFFTESVNVLVLKEGAWQKVGKYTSPRSDEIKKQLLDTM